MDPQPASTLIASEAPAALPPEAASFSLANVSPLNTAFRRPAAGNESRLLEAVLTHAYFTSFSLPPLQKFSPRERGVNAAAVARDIFSSCSDPPEQIARLGREFSQLATVDPQAAMIIILVSAECNQAIGAILFRDHKDMLSELVGDSSALQIKLLKTAMAVQDHETSRDLLGRLIAKQEMPLQEILSAFEAAPQISMEFWPTLLNRLPSDETLAMYLKFCTRHKLSAFSEDRALELQQFREMSPTGKAWYMAYLFRNDRLERYRDFFKMLTKQDIEAARGHLTTTLMEMWRTGPDTEAARTAQAAAARVPQFKLRLLTPPSAIVEPPAPELSSMDVVRQLNLRLKMGTMNSDQLAGHISGLGPKLDRSLEQIAEQFAAEGTPLDPRLAAFLSARSGEGATLSAPRSLNHAEAISKNEPVAAKHTRAVLDRTPVATIQETIEHSPAGSLSCAVVAAAAIRAANAHRVEEWQALWKGLVGYDLEYAAVVTYGLVTFGATSPVITLCAGELLPRDVGRTLTPEEWRALHLVASIAASGKPHLLSGLKNSIENLSDSGRISEEQEREIYTVLGRRAVNVTDNRFSGKITSLKIDHWLPELLQSLK